MRGCPFGSWLAFLLVICSGCAEWGGSLPENVIARVNEEDIALEDFDREFKELVLDSEKERENFRGAGLRRAYLEQVIERKILVQEARRLGLTVSPEDLNQAILEIKKDYPGEGLGQRLGLKGMALEEWKALLEERLLAEKMIRSARRYEGDIGDEEARQYYESHRSSFTLKERVRVRHIVVADGEEALQILRRLKRGESFEKLAMEKSIAPEKVQGGNLGSFSQGEKPPEFDRVFTLPVGAISEVIRSSYGYHIFEVVAKTEPRQISFEEAKTQIHQELRLKRGEEAYEQWLTGLRGKANVKVNKSALSS